MSRCFPYPPPGYTPTRNLDSSLIDSIKRQKEREKRHKERKERKKEKKDKERRKEKKDKAMGHNTDGYIKEKLLSDAISKSFDEAGVETLERSSLSEERGQPVMLVVPSSSFDSTDNSINKKRSLSQMSGNVIRMLQPCGNSINTKEHDLRYSREDQSGASLGISKVSDRKLEELHSSVLTENRSHGANVAKTGAAPSSKRHRAYLRFKDPMENWFPPSLQHHPAPCADNDMEWLFKSTNQEFGRPEEHKPATDTLLCSSSSSLSWSGAHYLPEVAMYALPYTVPY